MKSANFVRRVLPSFGFACMLGFAPLAMAQSATTPTTPVSTVAVKPAVVKLSSAERFTTLASATTHCSGDTVVWATTKVFHLAASKLYGKTKHGAYVCEKAAIAAGYHASKR